MARAPAPAVAVDTPDAGLAPVTGLRGVGPEIAIALAALGITRVQDLWFHLPLRYEDRTKLTKIRDLAPGMRAQVEGVVDACERTFRFKPSLRIALSDDSAATLMLRFFHFRAAQADLLSPGTRLRVYGEVRFGSQGLEMTHPSYQRMTFDAPLPDALTPVYPAGEGLGQTRLQQLVRAALAQLPPDEQLECLPSALRSRYRLGSLRDALRAVHQPSPGADVSALVDGRHPAQQRLAFDELLAHNLSLKRQRLSVREAKGPRIKTPGKRREAFRDALPFALTGAQQRVLGEIDRDLGAGVPMLRLVQGDVGSGKTVVAALAALAAIDDGWQVAVMAPTEILAEQHYRTFCRWLEPLGVRVVWLAGKVKGKARREALAMVAGEGDVIVGTHALVQDEVAFRHLGLAIVDEQHRFGVHQRLVLRDKGPGGEIVPHQLVMTATPIPRTLAMTAYADLDVSAIDELPPGRTPIRTVVFAGSRRDEVIARIRAACAQHRQAYWVCTLIEESDKLEAQAAQEAYDTLARALPELRVGLVHGRLKPAEKQAQMDAFARGETALLVATTVIEVGVDVPNASLMVIENAERLGLSQLHQLRGRVGRGTAESSCVLLYQGPLSESARQRLAVMRETGDGFRIAEEDLRLRGPGELLGTRQAGEAGFRVADLARDAPLLPDVNAAADALLMREPRAVERLISRWIGAATRFAQA